MDSRIRSSPPQGSRPLRVGRCNVQTSAERFGPGAPAFIGERERVTIETSYSDENIWPNPEIDDEALPASTNRTIPYTHKFRNNLTALSSAHNLYFVAYSHRIFVYKPTHGTRSRLDCHPDLQLQAKKTERAQVVGGTIDLRHRGQSINHIICGFLGDREIVLACSDNGDVFAFYTDDIADSVFREPRPPKQDILPRRNTNDADRKQKKSTTTNPEPFFHSNVKKSAWGLAIHRASRVIAVSSNRAEVTVFAFSLSTGPAPAAADDDEEGGADRGSVEAWVRHRRCNWKIIISLPPMASNVPNICFLDNEKGDAEKICAVDINGNTWVADIWTPFQPIECIPISRLAEFHSEELRAAPPRGWGILALLESHFMEVDTLEELLGAPIQCWEIPPAQRRDTFASPPPPPPPQAPQPQPVHNPHPTTAQTPHHDLLGYLQAHAQLPHISHHHGPPQQQPQQIHHHGATSPPPTHVPWHTMQGGQDQDPHYTTSQTAPTNAQHWLATNPNPFQQSFTALGHAIGEFETAIDQIMHHSGSAPAWVHLPGSDLPAPHDAPNTAHGQRLRRAGAAESAGQQRLPGPSDGGDMVYRPRQGWVDPDPDAGFRLPREDARARPLPTSVPDMRRGWRQAAGPQHGGEDAADPVAATDRLEPGYSLLRTYEKELELFWLPDEAEGGHKSRDEDMGVICPDLLWLPSRGNMALAPHFEATSRMNMVVHIPELSAVVLGSPTGHVALATLTRLSPGGRSRPSPPPRQRRQQQRQRQHGKERLADTDATHPPWNRGLRIDCILPRRSDEVHRPRKEARPLYGLAVGPAPLADDGRVGGGVGIIVPKRFRLVLHYQNHLILTYEVTRDEQTGKLTIF
ncbi:CRT10 [Geosmithia morbida]|uniref:CRT10 n=1 Tax=Geosmithia morbida TaxID=1094350 RepID=A0A9P5D1I9_9HYPO|nr:CRT10 [Geosmithia morbida]KAF4123963.1 CRT10 [Geosmithia morbida]